jgi:hypothetical protein
MTTKFGYSGSGSGERGPRGFPGKGISTITYDDPNDQLVITYDDTTTSNIPFPGVSLDTTANIKAYGANNANKLLVENNSGDDIFNVNTSTGTTSMTGISNNGGYTQTGTSNNNFTGITNISNNNSTVLSLTNPSGIAGLNFNSSGNSKTLQLNSSTFFIDGTLAPNANDTYQLGGTSSRWANMYSTNLDTNGTNTLSGTTSISGNLTTGASPLNFGTGTLTKTSGAMNFGTGNATFSAGGTFNVASTANFTGTIVSSGTNNASKFSVAQSGGRKIINVDTTNNTVTFLGSNATSSTSINGSSLTVSNTSGNGNWGQLIGSGSYSANMTDSLILRNTATGAGTGVFINMSGHNGTSVTDARLQFNGTHLLYSTLTGGDHVFNSNVRPPLDNTYTCGANGLRWSTVYAGSVVTTSDQREKNTITDEVLGLDFINELRPVSFKYNVDRNDVVYQNVPRVDQNGDPVYQRIPVLDQNGYPTFEIIPVLDGEGNPVFEQILIVDENGDPVLDIEGSLTYTNGDQIFSNGDQIFTDGPQIIDSVAVVVPVPGTKYFHGLIAQEIDTVLENNNLTSNDFAGLNKEDPNRYGVSYTEFIGPMIKSIQELKAIVDQQQQTINSLQTQINQIINQ